MVLTSDGSTLEGEYTLAPENWPSTYAAQAEAPLRLQVAGTWQQVKFEMMDPLPDWLLAITRERMEEELFDAREKLAADLRLHAEKKLQQLQGVAALLTVQAALTTQDSEQIATLAGDLEQHFEELNSENATEVEFARRTGSRLR